MIVEKENLKKQFPQLANHTAMNKLWTQLESCARMIDPDRRQRMGVLGITTARKSTLIKSFKREFGVEVEGKGEPFLIHSLFS